MQTLNSNPVTFSGWLLTVALAILALAAYYFQLTSEEVALWAALLTALSGGLNYWVAQRTVPTSLLQSEDGKPVTTAGVRGGQAVTRAPQGKGGF